MKILMLADGMERGGAESHLETLILGLLERGHEIGLLSLGGGVADRLKEAGVRCRSYARELPRWRALLRGRRLLSEILAREEFHVLHAHTRFTSLMMRGLAGKGSARGAVVTVHAAYPPTPVVRGIQTGGELVIAVSEDLRARLCDSFGVPPERISVIPNGVDCRRFFPPWEGVSPFSVLFASRLEPDCMEGARLLCELAPDLRARFPELRIRVAGGGAGLAELRKTVGRLEADRGWREPVISLLGDVEDMAAEYRRNRIVVGVSRVALEGAASGCAVVLCGNEGYGGILREADERFALSNFCCRGEAYPTREALERDLLELLAHPARTADLAHRTSRWVRAHFSAEEMVKATEEVYRRLMEEKGGLQP